MNAGQICPADTHVGSGPSFSQEALPPTMLRQLARIVAFSLLAVTTVPRQTSSQIGDFNFANAQSHAHLSIISLGMLLDRNVEPDITFQ